MFTTAQIQPIDQEIIDAVREIHVEQPKLGRGKLLAQLKDAHNWSLSDTRLKKLLAENNLKRQAEVPKTLPPIELPANAFAAQETYKKDGIRCFKLYGRGECDYGVTPNADMALLFNLCHDRLCKLGSPSPKDRVTAEKIARSKEMETIWNYYWAAAQKVGLKKEDIGRQIEAEYGANPIPFLPNYTKEQLDYQKAVHKDASMKLKREMLKHEEGRRVIPVDAQGEPVWDDAKNGQFVVVVVKINKGDGLTEGPRVDDKKQ